MRSRHPNRLRRHAAFTLIEVVMAAAVLALVIASALVASQRAFLALDTARNLETAAAIMETELEKERVLPWATVSSVSYSPTIDSGITSQPSLAGRFTLTRTTAVVAGHGGNMLQITLTVTWRNYNGRSHSRSHTTYYANGGLYDYFANPSST